MDDDFDPPDEPKNPLSFFNGAFRNVELLKELLLRAQRECHLIGPGVAVGALPEGFAVALTPILVDIEKETYKAAASDDEDYRGGRGGPGEERALGRTALDRIAAAAGVTFDPEKSGRQDEGRDPRYCHWRTVARWKLFDGSVVERVGDKEIDLHDDSDYVHQLEQQAARYNRSAEIRIRNERVQILSFAATKSRNRSIRDLGIRSKYTRAELAKPFVVARLLFTGASTDPELRRTFAIMLAQQAIGASARLYGPPPAALPAASAPPIDVPGETLACEYCGSEEGVRVAESPKGPIPHCSEAACVELAHRNLQRELFEAGVRTDSAGATPGARDAIRSTPTVDPDARARAPASAEVFPPVPASPGMPAYPRACESPLPSPRTGADAPPRSPSPPTPRRGGGRGAPRGPSTEAPLCIPNDGSEDALKPLAEASTAALQRWERTIRKRLDENKTPARYVGIDCRLRDAMRAEIDRRGGAGVGADQIPY